MFDFCAKQNETIKTNLDMPKPVIKKMGTPRKNRFQERRRPTMRKNFEIDEYF